MADSNAEVIRLLTEIKKSLERQFQGLTERFDAKSARLERHASDMQTGRRYFAKTGEWQERVDTNIDSLMRRVANLEKAKGAEPPAA